MAAKEWVLIVGGSILQWPAVRAARELGYKVMLSDRNPACYCADRVERFERLSTFDVDGHIELALHWRNNLAELSAVFTAGADPIVTVARAAEAAGCHGVPIEVAEKCANKFKTRVHLWDNGVPQPHFWYVRDMVDVWDIVAENGDIAAFMIKATGSSGSRGHTYGSQEDWYSDQFIESALDKAKIWSRGYERAIMEEWLDGTVLSVETLWYNGVMIPLNAVERPFDGVIELGHYNPLVTDAETYAAIWDVMEQAGHAVGMGETQGGHIFKGDLIITDEGPKVLELTTRLSGGFDSGWTSPLAHGVDYTKGALLLALGRPLEEAMPYFTPRWYRHAACIAVFGPEEGGVIKEIKTGGELSKAFGDTVVVYRAGDELPPLTDCTQRVAYCISEGDNLFYARIGARFMSEQVEVICE
ncbi:MAG: ATP-grasp domain-containing protein [Planctomycetota bacterium]|jgi:biotin carboxylase